MAYDVATVSNTNKQMVTKFLEQATAAEAECPKLENFKDIDSPKKLEKEHSNFLQQSQHNNGRKDASSLSSSQHGLNKCL